MFEVLRSYILPGLIPKHSKILVAVSGGPDSMALAHILWRYMHEEMESGISLVISHVHHGVRKESDQELQMVQRLAEEWGIPCRIHRFDSKTYAKTVGRSYQEAARDWRYARWQEDMSQEGCSLLATAHHLGDQAETVLYRLLRGSGTAGLAGIYPAKDSIIRPLLSFAKADIFRYCEQEGLPYAIDASNKEPVYARNKIRLELIPELERTYNPRIMETLGRMAELLRWDEEFLSGQTERAWNDYLLAIRTDRYGLSLRVFQEPPAILSRLLRKAAKFVSDEPRGLGYVYVTKIMESRGKLGWKQDLPGLSININEEGIWFGKPAEGSSGRSDGRISDNTETSSDTEVTLRLGAWVTVEGFETEVGLFSEEDYRETVSNSADRCFETEAFDKSLLAENPLVCRTRRAGDKMWFTGVGHKSLKKVFQEAKIQAERRVEFPLLLASNSEVFWLPRVRRSDLFWPEKNSGTVHCIFRSLNGCPRPNSL